MRQLVIIAHDIRSTHNVGSLLRTAEGLGIAKVYFTGYTPYPLSTGDGRLPHLAQKLDKQIAKTALGAEKLIAWEHIEDIDVAIGKLQKSGYDIVALEQTANAVPLPDYRPSAKVAIILGREVEGIDEAILKQATTILEIPMFGHKESFNVVQAAAMVLYHCRFS